METRTCPRCGSHVPTSHGWAKSAVSLLMQAPAIPDMATQLRCPNCQHLFADSDVRHQGAAPGLVLVGAALLVLVLWAVSTVF